MFFRQPNCEFIMFIFSSAICHIILLHCCYSSDLTVLNHLQQSVDPDPELFSYSTRWREAAECPGGRVNAKSLKALIKRTDYVKQAVHLNLTHQNL